MLVFGIGFVVGAVCGVVGTLLFLTKAFNGFNIQWF